MFTDGKCDEALEPLATLTAAYSALQSSNAIRIDSDVSDRWKNPRSSHTGVGTYMIVISYEYRDISNWAMTLFVVSNTLLTIPKYEISLMKIRLRAELEDLVQAALVSEQPAPKLSALL